MPFQKGHIPWMTGKTHTEESKKKMSIALRGNVPWNKGMKMSDEFRKNVSEGHMGQKAWNKGKIGYFSEESRKKIGEAHRGKTAWNSGMKMSNDFRKKVSEGHKGQISWNTGKKVGPLSDEHKRKMSEALKGKHTSPTTEFKKGENHPFWNNGSSFEPYGIEFNEELREQIRKRDGYRCQECFRHQNELRTKTNRPYKLPIHHIDYDKTNNDPDNLISLCRPCHAQTNYGREEWTGYFQNKIEGGM